MTTITIRGEATALKSITDDCGGDLKEYNGDCPIVANAGKACTYQGKLNRGCYECMKDSATDTRIMSQEELRKMGLDV